MLSRRLTRRGLLRTAVVAGAASALAACGATATTAPATSAPAATTAPTTAAAQPTAAPTPAPATAGGATIEVWNNNWGETYNAPMKLIGDQYTEETGNKINWSFNDQWQEKLLTSIAGGIPPDTCYTNWVGLPTLAFEGTMLALDDYFAQSGIKSTDFIKAMVDACVYEGKTYGIPGGADFLTLHYNKEVYTDVGLDPDQPPATIADWISHSEKIYKADSSGNFERMGMAPTDPGVPYTNALYGAQFYDPNSKKVTINSAENVEAFEWMIENSKRWDPEKVAAFTAGQPGYSQPNSGFATGKMTYMYNGYWTAEALDQYAPDLDYGIAFLPTVGGTEADRKYYVIQGWDYSIPQGSKQTDAAWTFLKYAFYDHAWEMGVKTINGCCVLAQMDQYNQGVQEWLGPDNRMTPYFDVFVQTGAAGTVYWPVMPVASRYWDELVRAQDFASRGEMTAQEALDECAKVVQDELDKAYQG
ncbi:MAG: type 2 periplasmic-binding domain-containing protein [Anaerolineae bacterium]